MHLSGRVGYVVWGLAAVKFLGVSGWPSSLVDDVSGLDSDEDSFYDDGFDVLSESDPDAFVEELSSDFGRRTRLLGRQNQPGTETTESGANPDQGGIGALPNLPTQNNNVSAVTNITNATNTTTGQQPGYIGNEGNPNNDQVNCSDLVTGRSNDCWAQLDLTTYVNEWVNTHQCYQGEGFSTCYLRQSGFPSLDCSQISVSSCPAPQSDSVILDPPKFYVAYNIYAINAFFYSWWIAVGNSGGIAVDNLGKIVNIINPPDTLSVTIQNVLVAFQSVFALAPGIAGVWAAKNAYSYGFQVWAQTISNALTTVPNIGRFLFPTGTADSKIVQLAELSANFASVLQQVQGNLNSTLVSVMSNVTEFLAFAEQGNFTSKPQSLPDQANYLYYAFNTYLISQALNGNNIYAMIGKGTDTVAMSNNGTELDYDLGDCKTGRNEQQVCDAWWWSGNYNSSFALNNFNHMDRNYGQDLTDLFTNLTSGELLFEGAYACNSQGNFGGPVNITVNAGGVNTACISQLKVLTWDMTCHNTDENGGVGTAPDCEFLELPKQPAFWYNNKHFMWSPLERSVPYAYLGPALTRKGKPPLKRD